MSNKIVNVSLDEYHGVLTPEEHAMKVTQLLEANSPLPTAEEDEGKHIFPGRKNSFSTKYQYNLLLKLRKKIREIVRKREASNPQNNKFEMSFNVGGYVTCSSNKIVTMRKRDDDESDDDGAQPCHGNLVMESEYFPSYWLVHFFEMNKYFYCSKVVLAYVSDASVTHTVNYKLCDGSKFGDMTPVISKVEDDHDLIMFFILNNKIHNNNTAMDLSYRHLAHIFAPHFPWMTHSKLQKYVASFQKMIDNHRLIMNESQTPAPQSSLDATNTVTPGKLFLL